MFNYRLETYDIGLTDRFQSRLPIPPSSNHYRGALIYWSSAKYRSVPLLLHTCTDALLFIATWVVCLLILQNSQCWDCQSSGVSPTEMWMKTPLHLRNRQEDVSLCGAASNEQKWWKKSQGRLQAGVIQALSTHHVQQPAINAYARVFHCSLLLPSYC